MRPSLRRVAQPDATPIDAKPDNLQSRFFPAGQRASVGGEAVRATAGREGGAQLAGIRARTQGLTRRAHLLAGMTGAGLWLGVGAAVAAPAVTGLSYVERPDGLRIVLDIAPAPVFTLFTLTGPDRLVIDFPELDWQVAGLPASPPASTHVRALRHGLSGRDRARIVVELAQPLAIVRAFTEPAEGAGGEGGPGRVLIDLAPVSRAEFDARAGAPELARRRGATPLVDAAGHGDLVVAIDPGHGGFDPGARVGGIVEKELVLRFANLLAAAIGQRPGFRAVLTREADDFVPLPMRVDRARAAGANLMISVHADVLAAGQARGVAAYTLSEAGTDDAAEALAARGDRSDVLVGADLAGATDDLTRLLVELAQRGTQEESARLAHAVLDSVALHSEVLRSRPLRQAGFRVLKAPDLPSILLELGFMDDPEDHGRLSDPGWLAGTAEAVARGIADWRAAASPGFTAPR